MEASRLKTWALGILGWLAALVLFFPIFWMALTAFKTEQQAYSIRITLATYVLPRLLARS